MLAAVSNAHVLIRRRLLTCEWWRHEQPRGSSVMSKGGRGGRSRYTCRLGSCSTSGGGWSIGMLSHDNPLLVAVHASSLLQCRIAHRRDQSISANTTEEALTSRAVKPCTRSPSCSSFMRALVVATGALCLHRAAQRDGCGTHATDRRGALLTPGRSNTGLMKCSSNACRKRER